jgi:hypothetical protein
VPGGQLFEHNLAQGYQGDFYLKPTSVGKLLLFYFCILFIKQIKLK